MSTSFLIAIPIETATNGNLKEIIAITNQENSILYKA